MKILINFRSDIALVFDYSAVKWRLHNIILQNESYMPIKLLCISGILKKYLHCSLTGKKLKESEICKKKEDKRD